MPKFIPSHGLLPYAETVADLKSMCEIFYANLKPGGSFFGISVNCQSDGDWGNSLARYGIESFTPLPPVNQTRRMKFVGSNFDANVPVPPFTITLSYFEPEVYERVFKEVGFKSFSLHPTLLDPDVVNEFPVGFWDAFNAKPGHMLLYMAEK